MTDFEEIKKIYGKIHKDFLRTGKMLTQHHKDGVWAPSIPKEAYKIFDRYSDKNLRFLDLGSGDGIVVMIASLFFKRATGIEIAKQFYDISIDVQAKLNRPNVDFLMDDFYNLNFGDYDLLYIAPDKEFSLKFENKIERELNGKLIVYSSIFQPKTLKVVDEFETHHFEVKVYENKAKKV